MTGTNFRSTGLCKPGALHTPHLFRPRRPRRATQVNLADSLIQDLPRRCTWVTPRSARCTQLPLLASKFHPPYLTPRHPAYRRQDCSDTIMSRPDPPRPVGTRTRSGRTTRPGSLFKPENGGSLFGDRPRQLWVINRPGPLRVATLGLNPALQPLIGRPILEYRSTDPWLRPNPGCYNSVWCRRLASASRRTGRSHRQRPC